MMLRAAPRRTRHSGRTGLVARTLHSSVVDGPGHRFVVFLQGCNFDCFNCHNPQTIEVCNDCGACLEVCAPGSLSLVDGIVRFDPDTCTACDRCLSACPIDSSPMVLERSVDSVLDELRPLAPFLSGITVTGGEPTLQVTFLERLFHAVKADDGLTHLTTFVDSNGSLDLVSWSRLARVMDGAMIDLKAVSPDVHRRITGVDNSAVLASIRLLYELGRLHEVRLLVIEGLTDTDVELTRYARFLTEIDPAVRLRLMAFRHHGVRPVGRTWPETSAETMSRVEDHLRRGGLVNVVPPPL